MGIPKYDRDIDGIYNDIWYMGYVGYAIKPYQNHVVLWGSIIVIGQTNSRAFGLWKVDGLDGTEWGIYHCQRRILKGQHVIARVCLKIQYPPILRVCQHSLHYKWTNHWSYHHYIYISYFCVPWPFFYIPPLIIPLMFLPIRSRTTDIHWLFVPYYSGN